MNQLPLHSQVLVLTSQITSVTLVSIGEENGNPLQYYCLENPMDGGAWRAIVHGAAKESDTT